MTLLFRVSQLELVKLDCGSNRFILFILFTVVYCPLRALLSSNQHVSCQPPPLPQIFCHLSLQSPRQTPGWSLPEPGELEYSECVISLQSQLARLRTVLCSSDSSRSPSPLSSADMDSKPVRSVPAEPVGVPPATRNVVRALQSLVNAQAVEIARQEKEVI